MIKKEGKTENGRLGRFKQKIGRQDGQEASSLGAGRMTKREQASWRVLQCCKGSDAADEPGGLVKEAAGERPQEAEGPNRASLRTRGDENDLFWDSLSLLLPPPVAKGQRGTVAGPFCRP